MSAALNTSIEMKGTNDELKKMIMVIKDYSGYNHDASLDFIKIKSKDDKTIENIDDMSKKKIEVFLCDCKKPIFVEAAGPYGRYGRMDEAGLFEALADVAPKARFKAHTEGFTTGQSDDFVGELKNGKLYLEYSFLPDEYKIDDCAEITDEEWFKEKKTYDPTKKEYKIKYSVENWVHLMMTRMPLNDFKELFGLSGESISASRYKDYIDDCYARYQFPQMDFIEFKYWFPNAKIDEEDFKAKIVIATERFDLLSYEDYCNK